MKRILVGLMAVVVSVWLSGCGQGENDQFAENVGTYAQKIEKRAQDAAKARNKLDAHLEGLQHTATKLEEDTKSLRESIRELSTSLTNLQEELKGLQNVQQRVGTRGAGGGWWKWLVILIIIILLIIIIYRFFLKPKPFDDDEDEDFSAFDEDLGYD